MRRLLVFDAGFLAKKSKIITTAFVFSSFGKWHPAHRVDFVLEFELWPALLVRVGSSVRRPAVCRKIRAPKAGHVAELELVVIRSEVEANGHNLCRKADLCLKASKLYNRDT